MSTTDTPRLRLLAALLFLLVGGLLVALAVRSTETWTAHDPAAVRRLLELREEARDFARRWETAQRGETRFAYDTEIRVLTLRIEELEARAQRPRRVVGLAPWERSAIQSRTVAVALLESLATATVAVALAFAVALALERAARGPRLAATALVLAPLALPPALLAERLADLAGWLGLGPSPGLAAVAGLLAAVALALLVLAATSPPLDPARCDVARDLGLSRRETFLRIVVAPRRAALGLAVLVVFARLVGDVSIARLGATTDRLDHWGGWLRHRVVAAVDHATAAAATLTTIAACVVLAGLVLGAIRRPAGPPAVAPPRRRTIPAAPLADRPVVPILFGLLAAIVVAMMPTDARLAPGTIDDAVTALVDWTRAGLAALLALAATLVLWRPLERAPAGTRRTAAAVALVAAAVPAPAVAFALRVAGEDLGLTAGAWIPIATGVVVATPVVLLLVLTLPPLGETAASATHDMDRRARHRRLAPLLPLAIVVATSLALAASDAVVVLGLGDRPRPWSSTVGGVAVSMVLLAVALAFGDVAARAFERTADRGGLEV